MKQIGALLLIVSSMFLASCGSGGGGSSSSVDSSEMATTIRAGVSFYDNLISSGIGKDVAVNDTVSWFKTKSDVSDAYPAADNRNIFIEETNGITTLFITDTFSNTSSSSIKNLLNKKSNDIFHLSLLSSNNSIKAVVMDPCNVPISNSSDVNKVFTDCTYAVVDYLKGENVTPEIIQNLTGNDLIYYIGHGGRDNKNGDIIWISTGVPFYKFNSYIAKYNDDPKKNNGKYKYFGRVATVFNVYLGVNSNFVRDFSKGLNATAVYVDACHSLDLDINDSMAQAFRNNGAKSYLGWGGLVFAWQGLAGDVTDQVAVSFFKDILACKSVSTAFNNLPIDWNISDLHYRGDGKLPICDPIIPIFPGGISVNPSSGSWTSTPQNLAASSSGATAIYYTMVNTTDGSIPADPREPTSSDNDGSISVSGGEGTFQLYATAGQYKRSKLRFRGFNSAGAGPASGVYSYSINLSATSPLPTLQTNAATATTLNGATLNGIINPNGSATNYWFEYGTSSTLVTYSSTPTKSAGSGTTSQSFGEAISGLQAGTTYYFRMAASCDAGTTRGSIQSFSTEISSVSKWWKIFDWAGWNDVAYDVRQTSDGGYIVIGYATIPGTGERVWLIKTDSNGDILWSKTYTSTYPIANSGKAVQQTSDGGYIIAGSGSASIAMGEDMVLIKTDSIGNILWMKILGGEYYDAANSVQQTSDDGYIIAGSADYYAGQSVYLIKMDSGGNILWSKKYGGAYDDAAYSVQQTSDGGYIIAGYTFSYGAGSADVYLIKTDAVGNMLWSKTFGGTGVDIGRAVRHTSDGGYIIVGDSSSFGTGGTNIYIIKTDSGGNMVWSKTDGGTGGYSYGRSVEQTSDGGYIIGGSTSSFGASGIQDMFLIKMDSSGNTLWYKTYYGGVTGDDVAYAVRQTSDGGYILAGSTLGDVFLIKTDANGNVQ